MDGVGAGRYVLQTEGAISFGSDCNTKTRQQKVSQRRRAWPSTFTRIHEAKSWHVFINIKILFPFHFSLRSNTSTSKQPWGQHVCPPLIWLFRVTTASGTPSPSGPFRTLPVTENPMTWNTGWKMKNRNTVLELEQQTPPFCHSCHRSAHPPPPASPSPIGRLGAFPTHPHTRLPSRQHTPPVCLLSYVPSTWMYVK